MKKILVAFCAVAALVACNETGHGDANLHITGNIKGLKQGKLYVQRIVDTSLVNLDTIAINGKSAFESHVKIDSPEMLFLFLDRGQTKSVDNNLPFFAEPGKMRIESTIDAFYLKAKVTGSENHKIYEDFLKGKKRYIDQNLDLLQKNIEATKQGDVARLDSIATQQDKLLKRRYLYTINFAMNNANREAGPYIALSEVYDANIKYLDTVAKSMSPKIAKSRYGKLLIKHINDRKKAESGQK
ncbi:hypothetical protein CHU92_06490 [Flavobacterium cyanobacteriorum]|uniref:DUF4369 domain-containing protein n=1 Tax=Flavobacterium cyanobacteriorum TaxID=2022802 RepID=A0A255Z9M4_9FLAO|nr:DUF4369 domain-containing protein [Flavobacterium cyanobacteriorum]OYQ38111.1 hypothetical protein CHU92_06490 [Flavobacterium cyanobacteriorum]